LSFAAPSAPRLARPHVQVKSLHQVRHPAAHTPAPAAFAGVRPAFLPVTFTKNVRPPAAIERTAKKGASAGSGRPRAPRCDQCGNNSSSGAGAHGSGSAGVVAALTRFRLFAPSGGGRVRHEGPTLGSPADIAPLERPG